MRKNKPSQVSPEKKTNASVDGTTRKSRKYPQKERDGKGTRKTGSESSITRKRGTDEGQKREGEEIEMMGKRWMEGVGKVECEKENVGKQGIRSKFKWINK